MTDHAETLAQALATGVFILILAIAAGFIVSTLRDWIKRERK